MNPAGLVLFPGAGSSATHASLVALEERLAPLPVRRVDFPYRLAGRKAPDRPKVLLAAVRDATRALADELGVPTSRLVIGGRSMGGRMCSMVAAGAPDVDDEAPLPVAGLVLVSYPLSPPGRPDKVRIEHLPRIGVPTLVIQGTRDDFGTAAEIERHFAVVTGSVRVVAVEGGRHELKGADALIADTVADWLK